MRAGELRHRCSVQRFQDVKGRGGSVVTTWLDVGKVWAEITIPTGRVAVAADQLTAEITAEIRVRYRADILAGMRITHGLTTYQIEAALPDNVQTMLRLLCSNIVNP